MLPKVDIAFKRPLPHGVPDAGTGGAFSVYRMIYEARLKAQRDEYSRLQGALNEGREESRQALAEKDWEIAELRRKLRDR
ncbi:MAG: hypothetical protein LBJ86_07040 [Spirochaetaceae bacterium]|jgi:hypothetical protein|nr:hypothetical protein [Spirochaetaceae bacterium]